MLVVDFGAQYAQLIARRVRELHVFSEIVNHRITADEVAAKAPSAIILSGGPASVNIEGTPRLDPAIYDLGVPIFGICYGAQLIAAQLGGTVGRGMAGEYGRAHLTRTAESSVLHADVPDEHDVWMSHFDAITEPPPGFAPRRARRTHRSPCWRTTTAGSGASSSIPRSCTRRTAWRCCGPSCTISPGVNRAGGWRR